MSYQVGDIVKIIDGGERYSSHPELENWPNSDDQDNARTLATTNSVTLYTGYTGKVLDIIAINPRQVGYVLNIQPWGFHIIISERGLAFVKNGTHEEVAKECPCGQNFSVNCGRWDCTV